MRARALVAVAGFAVAGLTLTGCSAISEGVSEATAQAACAVVTPIAESVGSQVQVVADEITVDPSGAITTLENLRTSIDGAVAATSGDIATSLTSVSDRLDELIAQAEGVRDGGAVSQETIDGIETSIVTSLTSLAGDC